MNEVGPENAHLEGGCACGAVRYRLEGDPIFVNNCHCTLCQRQSGTGSAVNAFYESDRVTLLSGELSTKLPWATVPDGLPQFQETYDFREVLPPERVARMMALAEKARGGAVSA